MRVKGFIRLHSCSDCQWGPQCLTILVVAPNTDKVLSSARLYGNMTNCSLTCETRSYHIKNACERLHKVAFVFWLLMGAAVPYSTCCCTKYWKGTPLRDTLRKHDQLFNYM